MNSASRWITRRFAISASALTNRSKFYKKASVVPVSTSSFPLYNVFLDNRKLRTPSGKVLETESEPLALAIAHEWNSQKKYLNMAHMRLTGLLFTALDNPQALKK
ncbi:ATP synthase mitochondrial F1 complex assembly factor 2 [Toxocara canis]|nr:ATP synthase mitochondrial F1 complex assembly factor 2 [Toxocara canis]